MRCTNELEKLTRDGGAEALTVKLKKQQLK